MSNRNRKEEEGGKELPYLYHILENESNSFFCKEIKSIFGGFIKMFSFFIKMKLFFHKMIFVFLFFLGVDFSVKSKHNRQYKEAYNDSSKTFCKI